MRSEPPDIPWSLTVIFQSQVSVRPGAHSVQPLFSSHWVLSEVLLPPRAPAPTWAWPQSPLSLRALRIAISTLATGWQHVHTDHIKELWLLSLASGCLSSQKADARAEHLNNCQQHILRHPPHPYSIQVMHPHPSNSRLPCSGPASRVALPARVGTNLCTARVKFSKL